MRYRGREMAHQELGMQVLNRVREELSGRTKTELRPKMEGRQMTMILSPDTE
jgi:translation initiation factor IF-3